MGLYQSVLQWWIGPNITCIQERTVQSHSLMGSLVIHFDPGIDARLRQLGAIRDTLISEDVQPSYENQRLGRFREQITGCKYR